MAARKNIKDETITIDDSISKINNFLNVYEDILDKFRFKKKICLYVCILILLVELSLSCIYGYTHKKWILLICPILGITLFLLIKSYTKIGENLEKIENDYKKHRGALKGFIEKCNGVKNAKDIDDYELINEIDGIASDVKTNLTDAILKNNIPTNFLLETLSKNHVEGNSFVEHNPRIKTYLDDNKSKFGFVQKIFTKLTDFVKIFNKIKPKTHDTAENGSNRTANNTKNGDNIDGTTDKNRKNDTDLNQDIPNNINSGINTENNKYNENITPPNNPNQNPNKGEYSGSYNNPPQNEQPPIITNLNPSGAVPDIQTKIDAGSQHLTGQNINLENTNTTDSFESINTKSTNTSKTENITDNLKRDGELDTTGTEIGTIDELTEGVGELTDVGKKLESDNKDSITKEKNELTNTDLLVNKGQTDITNALDDEMNNFYDSKDFKKNSIHDTIIYTKNQTDIRLENKDTQKTEQEQINGLSFAEKLEQRKNRIQPEQPAQDQQKDILKNATKALVNVNESNNLDVVSREKGWVEMVQNHANGSQNQGQSFVKGEN